MAKAGKPVTGGRRTVSRHLRCKGGIACRYCGRDDREAKVRHRRAVRRRERLIGELTAD